LTTVLLGLIFTAFTSFLFDFAALAQKQPAIIIPDEQSNVQNCSYIYLVQHPFLVLSNQITFMTDPMDVHYTWNVTA